LVLKIELQVRRLDVWYGNGKIDEVLGCVGLIGSLGPKDCEIVSKKD